MVMKTPLADILRKRGLSIADASRASGIPYVTIAQHVRGARGISAALAIKYERLLGIPRSELRPDLWPPEGAEGAAGLPSVCPAAGDVSASKSADCGEGGCGRGDRAAGEGSPAGATRRRNAACTITRP